MGARPPTLDGSTSSVARSHFWWVLSETYFGANAMVRKRKKTGDRPEAQKAKHEGLLQEPATLTRWILDGVLR